MSRNDEVLAALAAQGATEAGAHYVQEVRSSDPSRRVGGGKRSICVRFPSHKMGCSIQAESRNIEYPFVRLCEENPNIIEYFDQPSPITLRYTNSSGKKTGHKHTPDFLVVEIDAVYLVECKSLSELNQLAEKVPDRYNRNSSGNWYSPAGERATKRLGIGYRVWTPERLTTTFVRNLDFLYDYLRYEIA